MGTQSNGESDRESLLSRRLRTGSGRDRVRVGQRTRESLGEWESNRKGSLTVTVQGRSERGLTEVDYGKESGGRRGGGDSSPFHPSNVRLVRTGVLESGRRGPSVAEGSQDTETRHPESWTSVRPRPTS